MKWVFLLGLLILTPALWLHLRSNPKHLPAAAFFLALLPFIDAKFNLSASPIAVPTWPGIAKGIDISLTDGIALAMLLATGRGARSPTSVKIALGIYVTAFFVSLIAAPIKIPSIMYGWQIIRVVIVYLAVVRATASQPRVPIALLTGLFVGVAIQAIVAVVGHAGGASQAGGWIGEQNLTGMVTHLVVYPAFALFLGGRYSKWAAFAVLCAVFVAFAGGSRATIGLMSGGLIATAILSSVHRMTGRKVAIAFSAVFIMLIAAPIFYAAIERRSTQAREGSSEDRVLMQNAASMMISDHPFGVGANRYVIVANLAGYSARAGVPWNQANRAAPVHNTYYLTTAEMGWFGLVGLLSVLGTFAVLSFSMLRKAPEGFEGDFVVGFTVSVLMITVHAYFEWITLLWIVEVIFAMNAGLFVALRDRVLRQQSVSVVARTWTPNSATALIEI